MAARVLRASQLVSRSALVAVRPAIAARPLAARATAWAQPISRSFSATATKLGSGECKSGNHACGDGLHLTFCSHTRSRFLLAHAPADLALSQKLQEEADFEKENQEAMAGQEPEWLQEFRSEGSWTIRDKPEIAEVVLERSFGNEKLKLTFSIEDLDNPPDTSDLVNEAVDEAGEPVAPEDAEESFPIRATLSITKPTGGSMVLDLLFENENVVIDSASYYTNKALAEDVTAEGDWKRRATYVGPRKLQRASWSRFRLANWVLMLMLYTFQDSTTSTRTFKPSLKTLFKNGASTKAWPCSSLSTASSRNKT